MTAKEIKAACSPGWFMVLISLTFGIAGCKVPSSVSRKNDTVSNKVTPANNVVASLSENVASKRNPSTTILFEGENNLFEVIKKHSRYFGESHNVIVVIGNNNIIRLININLIDLRKFNRDTLVIVGENKKYVVDLRNNIILSSKFDKIDTVLLQEKVFKTESFNMLRLPHSEEKIRLSYFDSLVTAQFAIDYFWENIKTGQPVYYFELAEMYLYGVGLSESTSKAVELLEYAAVKDHVPSLMKLGDIHSGNFGYKKDKDKALYYYKRCRFLGELACDERILRLK